MQAKMEASSAKLNSEVAEFRVRVDMFMEQMSSQQQVIQELRVEQAAIIRSLEMEHARNIKTLTEEHERNIISVNDHAGRRSASADETIRELTNEVARLQNKLAIPPPDNGETHEAEVKRLDHCIQDLKGKNALLEQRGKNIRSRHMSGDLVSSENKMFVIRFQTVAVIVGRRESLCQWSNQ
jgi:hypothetical protein